MLNKIINNYIEIRRTMGFKFKTQSCLLLNFGAFAKENGDIYVLNKTVIDWARLAPSSAQRRNRLLTVRRFAIAMQVEDKHHEIPSAEVFGRETFRRRIPYILSSKELQVLLTAALKLRPVKTIRAITYATLFALLAVTGLRISEALALNIKDITKDGLIIRATKFRKDRLVPLHESTKKGLQRYLEYRSQYGYGCMESVLFISTSGTNLAYSTVNSTFKRLASSVGLSNKPNHPDMRIHDLRHSFAVKSLEQFNGNRADASRHMTALSTYLGHAHISDTYWYLHSTPVLMKKIAATQEIFYRRKNHD